MSVVQVEKINIVSTQDNQEAVMGFLHNSGVMEVREIKRSLEPPPLSSEELKTELTLSEIRSALNFIDAIAKKKKGFIESFIPERELVQESALQTAYKDFDFAAVIKEFKGFEAELTNLHHLTSRLKEDIQKLTPWIPLQFRLDQLKRQKLCLNLGIVTKKNLEKLKAAFLQDKLTHFEQINQINDVIYFAVINLTCFNSSLVEIFNKNDARPVDLPQTDKTPAQEIAQMQKVLKESQQDEQEIIKSIVEQKKNLVELKCVFDYLYQQQQQSQAWRKARQTRYTFILSGWIKKKDLSKLETGLKKISSSLDIIKAAPNEGEIVPTAIENRKPLIPFELITKVFGVPVYDKELDPTGSLSFFFIFFFGMCLSDVGYGLLLMTFSVWLMKKYRLPPGGQALFSLMTLGGLAAMIAGALIGSYFGADISQAGAWAGILKTIKIIDPIREPLTILIFSLFVGVAHIMFGLLLNALQELKNKNYEGAILDNALWIVFLLALVVLVATLGTNLIAKWAAITCAIILVLTQGRSEPTIIKKAISGILSLYKTTGYLGDTLSYSRLLALMMTTGIIGMVVNILAGMTKEIPALGYVIMGIVLVIGHVFNLVISVLGAFVHSLRLQLVEFFGKFYSGSGTAFKPFQRETQYTVIVSK